MMFAIGRAAELGFPATALGQWAGKYYIDLITQCSNPYLIQMGRYPATKVGTWDWFSNWTDFRNAYTSDYANRMYFSNDGYEYIFSGMVAVAHVSPGNTKLGKPAGLEFHEGKRSRCFYLDECGQHQVGGDSESCDVDGHCAELRSQR